MRHIKSKPRRICLRTSDGTILGRNQMETEVRTLKQELARTQEALKAATKKCRDLVRQLDERALGHESEKALRDQQLSRILRALLVLESRLKQEQKSIRQLLCEKDNVIRNQQLEIAKLRRYTKNYIKCKRDQTVLDKNLLVDNSNINLEQIQLEPVNDYQKEEELHSRHQRINLSKDIQSLKNEIITRLNPVESTITLENLNRGTSIHKTHSFAGSDISKISVTSSENTDASIVTTTTEGSPSLISTEGFCEGESTDVSPSSTLNKSNRRPPVITVSGNQNDNTTVINDNHSGEGNNEGSKSTKRRIFHKTKSQKNENGEKEQNDDDEEDVEDIEDAEEFRNLNNNNQNMIARTESKDDGLDCNFVSDEEKESEPIYINGCSENNSNNFRFNESRESEDLDSHSNVIDGNSMDRSSTGEAKLEETSGNWYSDPDEDRNSDDVFRHTSYRPNSNHNSVLECVNQILLRDMEEEEHVLSIPRKFKHRGRIVRFQPARLSDIESVGSEMERKNSEEGIGDKETTTTFDNFNDDANQGNFEATNSEDEFGMRIVQRTKEEEQDDEDDSTRSKAIPIVIIEPTKMEEPRYLIQRARTLPAAQLINPPLKMERIEEKTCLQMSTKGLTIAKNLDYEDIESLPEITPPLPSPKTPPALPPKPQFKNNTLILKKIPSPSFLIDESRKKQSSSSSSLLNDSLEHGRKILGLISSPKSTKPAPHTAIRNLNLEESVSKEDNNSEDNNLWNNRFNNVRSSFQSTRQNELSLLPDQHNTHTVPNVTNIVRHFEEFKIGGENEDQRPQSHRCKTKERMHTDFDTEIDIRQTFEEFNLDECDLSDDPNRPEADGSERLKLSNVLVENIDSSNDEGLVGNFSKSRPQNHTNTIYDHFLEATGLSNKSILTPSRLLSNHKSMLKPKDIKYKNKIKASSMLEKHGSSTNAAATTTHVRHWTGPFV